MSKKATTFQQKWINKNDKNRISFSVYKWIIYSYALPRHQRSFFIKYHMERHIMHHIYTYEVGLISIKNYFVFTHDWYCSLKIARGGRPCCCTAQSTPFCIDQSLPPLAGGWPLTQPNYHFSLGGKSCALTPLNRIPNFPKKKHKFLSDLSSKSSTFMGSICMIA